MRNMNKKASVSEFYIFFNTENKTHTVNVNGSKKKTVK